MQKLNAIANALQNWIGEANEKKKQKADKELGEEIEPVEGSDEKAARVEKSISKAMNMEKSKK